MPGRLQTLAAAPPIVPRRRTDSGVRLGPWLALALGVAAVSAHAAKPAPQSPSLCAPDERILFTCTAEPGIYSVCASANLSRSSGYLQYRSGRDPLSVEFEYPKQKIHPMDLFAFSVKGDRKRASIKELQFVADGRHHVLRVFESGASAASFGVEIAAPGDKRRLVVPCASTPAAYEHLLKLQALELPAPDFLPDGS